MPEGALLIRKSISASVNPYLDAVAFRFVTTIHPTLRQWFTNSDVGVVVGASTNAFLGSLSQPLGLIACLPTCLDALWDPSWMLCDGGGGGNGRPLRR